jgi:hypothetical protein
VKFGESPKVPHPRLVAFLDLVDIPGLEITYLGNHGIHLVELKLGDLTHRGTLNLEYSGKLLARELLASYKKLIVKQAVNQCLYDGKPIEES